MDDRNRICELTKGTPMALTSITTVDIPNATQTITFSNPGQLEQITFSSDLITFSAISTFNLSKSDMILYGQYIRTFNNLLLVNFPSVSSSVNLPWPLSQFHITTSMPSVKHIIYTQSSQGTQVTQINYVPTALAGSFATRAFR